MRETTIIRGGTVYHGSLNHPRILDIKIDGDRVVALGKLKDTTLKIIDAKGCIRTPGFIDIHNHSDNTCISAISLGVDAREFPELKGNINYRY